MKLRNKLVLISVAPLLLALAVQAAFASVMEQRALEAGLSEKARSVARLLVGVVGPNLLFKDAAAAKDGLKFLEADGDFLFAAALAEDGKALTSIGPAARVERFNHPRALPTEVTIETGPLGALVAMAPAHSEGKVIGAVVIGLSQAKLAAAGRRATLSAIALAVLSLGFCGLLAWLTAGHILLPISATVRVLEAVSAGDLTPRLEIRTRDEIGQMGHAVNAAIDRVAKTLFGVQGSLDRLSSSATALGKMGHQLGENASSTSSRAIGASAAAETISGSATTVAAATVQMGGSVKEIARNAADAARIANDAVRSAEATSKAIGQLDESSREIGDVVKVISDIAELTNLLALNATIEAARAGDAGKGFAVVATEVKELARQTARATGDIGGKVSAIQKGIRNTVEAIRAICGVIREVHEYQVAIAGAVEEQAQVTRQIGLNAAGAAEASSAIAGDIASLAQTARATAAFSADSQRASAGLSAIAVELQGLVSAFRFVRAPEKVVAGLRTHGPPQVFSELATRT